SEIPGRAELAGRVDVTCQTAQLDTPIAFRECAPIDCCRHVVAPNDGRWKDAKDVKVPEPREAELLIDGTGADALRQHLLGASPADKISPGIRGDARVADKVAAVGQVGQTVNSTSDHTRQMYIIPVARSYSDGRGYSCSQVRLQHYVVLQDQCPGKIVVHDALMCQQM